MINGLTYIENYITPEQEEAVVNWIDNQGNWLTDLKRRVQHYGYRYNYRSKTIDESMRVENLPKWALNLGGKLFNDGYFNTLPDQLIINEYEPGQGISAHVDCIPCFGSDIVSISLLSSVVMEFQHLQTKEKKEMFLEPRSLLVLTGDARYKWTHAIPARMFDNREFEMVVERKRRISLTFRNVILGK